MVLYRTLRRIGKRLNCSPATVLRWQKDFALPLFVLPGTHGLVWATDETHLQKWAAEHVALTPHGCRLRRPPRRRSGGVKTDNGTRQPVVEPRERAPHASQPDREPALDLSSLRPEESEPPTSPSSPRAKSLTERIASEHFELRRRGKRSPWSG